MKKINFNSLVLNVVLLSLLSIVEVFSATVSTENVEKIRPVITSYYPSSGITRSKCEIKSYKTEFCEDFVGKWSAKGLQRSAHFVMVGDSLLATGVQYYVKVLSGRGINGMSITADSISDEQLYLSLEAVLPHEAESDVVLSKSITVLSDTSAPSYSGGSGTSSDPYIIATQKDLFSLSGNSTDWSKHFKQTADIHFSTDSLAVDWDAADHAGYSPIGNSLTPFTGSYNGQDFNIINLNVSAITYYAGMFGYCDGATLKNVNLVNVMIYSSSGYVGGLAGSTSDTDVSQCYVSGYIKGTEYVGGLIGYAQESTLLVYLNSINACNVDVCVEGGSSVGGLIGYVKSTDVNTSCAYGIVTNYGNSSVGALVGQSVLAEFTSVFSSSEIIGRPSGSLIGVETSFIPPVNSYYYYDDISLDRSSYEGWNYTSIWTQNSQINDGFPYLQSKADLFESVITDFKTLGTWSTTSNWTNGLPSSSLPTYAAVWDSCEVSSAVDVKELKVGSESVMELKASGSVTVDGDFILTSDARGTAELELADGAGVPVVSSFIQEKYLKSNQWNFICAPVDVTADAILPELSMATSFGDANGEYWLARYDEELKSTSGTSGMDWVYDPAYVFAAGEGIMIWVDESTTISYEYNPILIQSVTNLTTAYTANNDVSLAGWNLVSNPRTVSLTFDDIFTCPNNQANYDSTLYVWDNGSYKVSTDIGDQEALSIAPLQSFFVKQKVNSAASLCLEENCGHVAASTSLVALRSAINYKSDVLTVVLESDGLDNKFYLRIHDAMTDAFDANFDAYKFSTSSETSPLVYGFDSEGHALAINSIPVDGEKEVPLVVKTLNQTSSFNMSFDLVGDIQYSLVDKQVGETYEISDSSQFSFVGESTSMTDRFVILVKSDGVATSCDEVGDDPANMLDVEVDVSSNLLSLISEEETGVQVNIVDMSGRLVYDNVIQSYERSEFSVIAGVYILNFKQNDISNSLKVVVR